MNFTSNPNFSRRWRNSKMKTPPQKDLIREVLKFQNPPLIPEAVVAAEDQRFISKKNFGIDPQDLFGGFVD